MLANDLHLRRDMTNTNQAREQSPQWSNYNWNHMALPTFGFIFAVPEPPSDLHIPSQQDVLYHTTTSAPENAAQQSARLGDEPDDAQHSRYVPGLALHRLC